MGAQAGDRLFLGTALMPTIDLEVTSLRDFNQMLHDLAEGANDT